MSNKAICYRVYPGDSARWFPSIQSLIFVKPKAYKNWQDDQESVKFEDVLADPADPVKFIWTDFSGKRGYVEPYPEREIAQWYSDCSDNMAIAKLTALKGQDVTNDLKRMLKPKQTSY